VRDFQIAAAEGDGAAGSRVDREWNGVAAERGARDLGAPGNLMDRRTRDIAACLQTIAAERAGQHLKRAVVVDGAASGDIVLHGRVIQRQRAEVLERVRSVVCAVLQRDVLKGQALGAEDLEEISRAIAVERDEVCAINRDWRHNILAARERYGLRTAAIEREDAPAAGVHGVESGVELGLPTGRRDHRVGGACPSRATEQNRQRDALMDYLER